MELLSMLPHHSGAELTGWLLDLYADSKDDAAGCVVWLLSENAASQAGESGACSGYQRHRLKQLFPITFYASGPAPRLRALWQHLESQDIPVCLSRTERRDLFQPNPITVMAIRVLSPALQPILFARISKDYPDLTYYDADLAIGLRHAALYGTFPLAHVKVSIDEHGTIQAISPLDTPWDLEPEPPPLQILTLQPNSDPRHAAPKYLDIRCGRSDYRLSLDYPRPLLINLAALLNRHDPDLLLTAWGDTWLLPLLLELSEQWHLPLPLNRDSGRTVLRKDERSYFTYGQIVHRGGQVQLFGRWHIDIFNAVMFHDYGMDGIFESARVTALPVQDAARLSPGTGISAMQIITALRLGVLVPWHKQQSEMPKNALDLLHADQGGLVYQPLVGLHRDVAELDFVSMYPSIMTYFNVSPETVGMDNPGTVRSNSAEWVPELNLVVDRQTPGLVPQTLRPLLEKRIAFKNHLVELPKWDPRRVVFKARASAHKWLLVTCFGYLGYKNARFGRIEAHQAVTAYSRECLLRAKEVAEEQEGTVLHLYVDGLWVQKPGCSKVADFQPMLEEIFERTHLPIALDGIYRWVAFLPSRVNARVPVANRYFGVFQDGSLKVRGIEARRRDTPPFISQVQMRLLEILAQAPDVDHLPQYIPALLAFLRQQVTTLRAGRVPLPDLLVIQKLSRELELYRTPSPAAVAAAQLVKIGKTVRPGQSVRFHYTLGSPGVYAWDLTQPLDPASVDIARYVVLLLRAVDTVLQPLGVNSLHLLEGKPLPLIEPRHKGYIEGAGSPRPYLPASLGRIPLPESGPLATGGFVRNSRAWACSHAASSLAPREIE